MNVNPDNVPLWRFFGCILLFVLVVLGLPFLLTAILPHSELVDAAAEQNWQQVKRLVSQGADVNGTDERDHTALMYAAMDGRTDVIQLLLVHGANVNATANDGAPVIAFAGERPHVQAILRKAGAKP